MSTECENPAVLPARRARGAGAPKRRAARTIEARRSETPLGERVFERERKEGTGKRGPRIRCPRCAWEPEQDSTWMCTCLHVWNTFDTGGKCPGCGRQWLETQCLRCHQWSPHRDWYADDEED